MAEFDACVVGGELPVDLALGGVGGGLPGGEFGVEDREVVDAAVEALAGDEALANSSELLGEIPHLSELSL